MDKEHILAVRLWDGIMGIVGIANLCLVNIKFVLKLSDRDDISFGIMH